MITRPWDYIVAIVIIALPLFAGGSLAGELTGRVFDSESGKPIDGATIRVLDTERSTATDKRGLFELKSLPDGTYRILVTHVAYDMSDTVAVALSEGSVAPLEVRLNPKPWVLHDVVVTGTRSPYLLKDVPVQTEVITQRDFARTGAKTVDQALSSAIGIQVTEDLSGQGAQIRGIDGDRVLVLVDGERAVGRVRGSIDLSQFALTNVKKIEVVKGTGSTLYGSDAMGGVINIITENPSYNKLHGRFYADYGSFTSYQPSAEFEYGNDKIALTLGGKLYSTDGFDLDKSTRHTNGLEATDRVNVDSRIRARLSDRLSLTGSGGIMWEQKGWIEEEARELNAHGDSLFKAFNDEEANTRYDGSVGVEYLAGDVLSLGVRAYATYYDHEWDKYDSLGYWVDTSKTEDLFAELSFHGNYRMGSRHTATFGASVTRQDLTSSELIDDAKADRSESAYLQYEFTPTKSLAILPGVRYEHHNSFGDHINPSFNIMYQPVSHLRLRGLIGYGFRAPSIKEQYFIFDHTAAGYIVYGGLVPFGSSGTTNSLKEEISINSSISAEFSYGSVGLHRLTYYYNHLEDLIDFELQDFNNGYWRGRYVYGNINAAVTQGIEWESRVRLSSAIDVSFSYTYLHNVILNTDSVAVSPGGDTTRTETGNKLTNRPDNTFKLFITGYHEGSGFGATFWGDYHSRKLFVPLSNNGGNEGAFDIWAPSRTTLNLNVFKRWDNGVEAFVRLENLLDETDVRFGYWPGLELFVGLKYDLTLR
ncbi:TonB-dependent receptor [bacterium]|nr:TonB-dependent receptor [bacterium]